MGSLSSYNIEPKWGCDTTGYPREVAEQPYELSAQVKRDISEQRELLAEAQDALFAALEDGRKHGYKGEWKQIRFDDHIRHAYRHCQGAMGSWTRAQMVEHLQHAVCRLTMALVRAEEHWRKSPPLPPPALKPPPVKEIKKGG